MSVYRADPKDGVAWVTGASYGMGRHVALDLARDGYTVAATARSADKLEALAAESASLPGRILAFPADVTDPAAMKETVAAIEREAGEIVLAVFNAGNYFPTRGDALEAESFVKTYEINVFGVIYGLVPVIERMKAHGRGQVAMVGSVSGYGGLPTASAYGASKAAINNMAAALKFDFDRMNIRLQVVNPGFVDTPLTRKNRFSMPALVPVEKASRRLVDGLRKGGFEITFPRRLSWALKFVNLLPYPLYFRIVGRSTGLRPGKGS